jgi:hypothetical protein
VVRARAAATLAEVASIARIAVVSIVAEVGAAITEVAAIRTLLAVVTEDGSTRGLISAFLAVLAESRANQRGLATFCTRLGTGRFRADRFGANRLRTSFWLGFWLGFRAGRNIGASDGAAHEGRGRGLGGCRFSCRCRGFLGLACSWLGHGSLSIIRTLAGA